MKQWWEVIRMLACIGLVSMTYFFTKYMFFGNNISDAFKCLFFGMFYLGTEIHDLKALKAK